MNKTAEYYVKHSSEIDLTKGTYVPEAPRIQRLTTTDGGHSEQVANSLAKEKPGRLVGSPKKASPSKKVKKTGMSTIKIICLEKNADRYLFPVCVSPHPAYSSLRFHKN